MMQVVPMAGTGDGTMFRKTLLTNALVLTLMSRAGLKGTCLTKVWSETLEKCDITEPAVVQAILGKAGSGIPEQIRNPTKGWLH